MNCQEVSRTLDSRDVNGLSATERRACETHAMSCRRCGPDWVVYMRLAAIPSPPMPPELAVRCEALAAGQNGSTNGRRPSNRVVLLGTLLVVAAAAAMLAVRLMNVPSTAGAALDPVPVLDPGKVVVAADSPAPAESEAKSHEEKAKPGEAAVNPFTVRVLPLQNEVTDPAGNRAVASTYVLFLDRLRDTPGLLLLEPDSTGDTPQAQLDYQITITGTSSWENNKFAFRVQVDTLQLGKVTRMFFNTRVIDVASNCASPPMIIGEETVLPSCADPQGVAASLVGNLRQVLFPQDPSLARQFQARLLDQSLDARERLKALRALLGRPEGMAASARATPPLDSAAIRGAVDLATTASDPMVRAAVWDTLRGTGNADLIPPLLAALGRDPDGEVRHAALGTLVGEFGEDPRVLAAFKATAEQDARPLIRALAYRAANGMSGDAQWKEYILLSLKDSSRPAVERIEALFLQMDLPTTRAYSRGSYGTSPLHALKLLDDDAIKAFTETLPIAAADSPIVQGTAIFLVTALGQIEHPAITDMLLASLDDNNSWLSRGVATEALGAVASRRNDPRVRAALENINSTDPSLGLRQISAAALQGHSLQPSVDLTAGQQGAAGPADSATSAEAPPRLGVSLYEMRPGPYVPKELIGKAVISGVGPESVAQKAGLIEGDVLLEINGVQISTASETPRIVQAVPRGVDIDVMVYRLGETLNLKARF